MRWFINAQKMVVFLLLLGSGFLAVYNLDGYPDFMALDEGFRLYFARNVTEHGKWAILTQDGYQEYWRDSTGLLVLGSVIAAFKLFGPSLWLARLLVSVFLIAGVVTVYLVVHNWYGQQAAILAVALFLFFGPPWLNSVTMGRCVYGEVPALVLFITGCWLWSRAVIQPSRFLPAASLTFALAVLAKDLFAPVIIAAIVITSVYQRWRGVIVPRLCVILPMVACLVAFTGWSLFQYIMSLLSGFGHQHNLVHLSLSRVMIVSPLLWFQNAKFLYDNGVLFVIPSVLYVLFIRKTNIDSGFLVLSFFLVVWSIWYIGFSIGWPRYAYPIWAVGGIMLAILLDDIRVMMHRYITEEPKRLLAQLAYPIFIGLSCVIIVLWPAQNTVRRLFAEANDDAQMMAMYIDRYIPADARIVSGQWDIWFYSSRTYIPIPAEYYESKIAKQVGKHVAISHFTDMNDLRAEYIIDGHENQVVEMVPFSSLQDDYELVYQNASYRLYRLKP
ncbi:MAG: hypothetical protein KatS3mg054_1175 [Chloroflexus sp.]|jgi:4-amino-4-deoxy-L-arabinose transferase-like glycosyltransferase|uniref:Glycosyltransferase RgtA/B/C/D-like domain-containing protein n=1 Tax=Chloroflexus aurantiacus (strain ATCC 29366 / DSM 635 / J-10-fl) TaxID=324602 RepID=A9WBZ3_CHLAA|nr:glycosyltransferase family 39 protein [Chloroflexus aurantiacus]RMG47845.1 MAG: hypothetical protein D6716_14555 [Chloroflexota bacterium]GIV87146.1 MAG: hypothetical protein KatS3mg054_1175 [Chloroflexus sp.]ABY36945.1 hypothetical protein Caur_3767 [Chloroflexus aurantiacus J-10-fl]GIV93294.1 MAG: hypothetical protein KatS3mg056_2003 [Chloroflexus sp.]HBW66624.1 hypothetical protein [Chloroflexus aurantiacus]